MKDSLVLVGICAFALCVTGLYFVLRPDSAIPEGYTTDPGAYVVPVSSTPVPTEGYTTIDTADGVLRINDVRKQPETVMVSDGMYAVMGLNPDRSKPFVMSYHERDDSFTVSLLREPLAETRQQMERVLQKRLGVSTEELCTLRILVGVPVDINSFYTGTELGLSFCPGAVQL